MPTKTQLESSLKNAVKSGDNDAARMMANAIKSGQFDAPDKQDKLDIQATYDKFKNRQDYGSLANTGLELASGISRGGANVADFFTTKPVRAVQQLLGVEEKDRLPTLANTLTGATTGNFMDEGLAKDVVRKTGEIIPEALLGGGVLRQASKILPALAPAAETMKAGILRQMGSSTAAADLGYGAVSGATGELGGATGEALAGKEGRAVGEGIGMIFGPMVGAFLKEPLTLALKSMGTGAKNMFLNEPKPPSTEGVETLLAEAMVRSNMTPDEAIAKLKSLGPDAMPADISDNFTRLLKKIKTDVPRVQGVMNKRLDARQAGSSERMLKSLDDSSGMGDATLAGEIQKLDDVMKPQIRQLYADSSSQYKNKDFSPRLKRMFGSDTSIGKANRMAQSELKDRRLIGDSMTKLDEIDATKRILDDQIQKIITSQGMTNKARRLVMMKNEMIAEADGTIPVYGQARNMYAGKFAIEDAGKMGGNFFKIKSDDMPSVTQTYGDSEKQMFKLGAKKAIVDKVNDIRTNANVVDRLFGKNGDVQKLKYLFDDEAQFKNFSDTLERESRYSLTRRTLQGGSDTKANIQDDKSIAKSFKEGMRATSNPDDGVIFINNIMSGLRGNKQEEIYQKALEDAGFILSQSGMDLAKLQMLMKRGNAKDIAKRLNKAIKGPMKAPYLSGVSGAALIDSTERNN